jgi:ATP-dependent protease ClpP protease subunit
MCVCMCVCVCECVSNNKADVSFVCSAWAARAGVPIAPADSVQLHKHH